MGYILYWEGARSSKKSNGMPQEKRIKLLLGVPWQQKRQKEKEKRKREEQEEFPEKQSEFLRPLKVLHLFGKMRMIGGQQLCRN